MEALVKKGKIRTIGVSNFSIAKINEIWDAAEIKPAVNQVELHPYFAQPELVKWCQDKVSETLRTREHQTEYSRSHRGLWLRPTLHLGTTSIAYRCKFSKNNELHNLG